jgi:hypothetical protein
MITFQEATLFVVFAIKANVVNAAIITKAVNHPENDKIFPYLCKI